VPENTANRVVLVDLPQKSIPSESRSSKIKTLHNVDLSLLENHPSLQEHEQSSSELSNGNRRTRPLAITSCLRILRGIGFCCLVLSLLLTRNLWTLCQPQDI
jgi:hypothetical protein